MKTPVTDFLRSMHQSYVGSTTHLLWNSEHGKIEVLFAWKGATCSFLMDDEFELLEGSSLVEKVRFLVENPNVSSTPPVSTPTFDYRERAFSLFEPRIEAVKKAFGVPEFADVTFPGSNHIIWEGEIPGAQIHLFFFCGPPNQLVPYPTPLYLAEVRLSRVPNTTTKTTSIISFRCKDENVRDLPTDSLSHFEYHPYGLPKDLSEIHESLGFPAVKELLGLPHA